MYHGHRYMMYHYGDGSSETCRSKNGEHLYEAWCKLRAIRQAEQDLPDVKVFLFLDSDAVVQLRFFDQPLGKVMHNMSSVWPMQWDINSHSVLLNEDPGGDFCDIVEAFGLDNCINTGTIMWRRTEASTNLWKDWWISADDSYAENNLGRQFRIQHPWDQVRGVNYAIILLNL